MKIFAAFFLINLFLASAFIVHAQSLAELAEKEKERRSKITKARVITVEEAAKYITEPKTPAAKKNPEEKARESEAVTLFLQSARRVIPGFEPGQDELDGILESVRLNAEVVTGP